MGTVYTFESDLKANCILRKYCKDRKIEFEVVKLRAQGSGRKNTWRERLQKNNAHGNRIIWTSVAGQANDVVDFVNEDLERINPDIISITAPCQDLCGSNGYKKGFVREANENGLTHMKCAQILNYFRKKNENLMVLTENVLMETNILKLTYESLYGMRCFCIRSPGITTRDRYFMSTIEPGREDLQVRTMQQLLNKIHKGRSVTSERDFLPTFMAGKDNGGIHDSEFIDDGGWKRKITLREAYASMGLEDLYCEGPFYKVRSGED